MKNKIVVITGGATGIGLAIARELLSDNTVISLDRNPTKIAALRSALPHVHSIKADVTLADHRHAALASIEKEFGRIDLLINNAGIGGTFDFLKADEDTLQRAIANEIAVNYEAPILLTKLALPLLKKSNDPTVVVTTTGLVYTPMAIIGSYCASKAAAHFAAMSLRHLLAPEKIRVVEVLPPSVDSELNFAKGVKKMPPEIFAKQFLAKLSRGQEVINVGQSVFLEKLSRLAPKMAFRMLNSRSGTPPGSAD